MKRVLIIAPHMDDEVLGCGGTICKYVKEKCIVEVCFVCNRAYNHQYDEKFINEEKRNALAAKKILKYQEHVFLDLNDERLDERIIDVIVPIEKVVKKFKPQVVYIPHRGDNNQDHRIAHSASMVALRTFASPYVEEIYAYETPSSSEQSAPSLDNIFIPRRYVDIGKFISHKKNALDTYQRENRGFPHPRSVKAIDVWAMKRGVEAYLEFAEAFEVVRVIKK